MQSSPDAAYGAVFLTRDAASRFLAAAGVPMSKSTLYTWAHKRVGPPYEIRNGRAVYRKAVLEAWLSEDVRPAAA